MIPRRFVVPIISTEIQKTELIFTPQPKENTIPILPCACQQSSCNTNHPHILSRSGSHNRENPIGHLIIPINSLESFLVQIQVE
jgi:hypothetical protein